MVLHIAPMIFMNSSVDISVMVARILDAEYKRGTRIINYFSEPILYVKNYIVLPVDVLQVDLL